MRIFWIVVALLVWGASPADAQADRDARRIFLGASGSRCQLGSGVGSPEGSAELAATGPVCSQYINITDGKLWRKDSGTGNTGWVLSSGLTGAQYCIPYFTTTDVIGCAATFTFTTGTTTLGVNNISSQVSSPLALIGAAGTASGSAITITGGTSSSNGSTGGPVTIAGGSPISGSSTNSGSVTIKTGDVQNNSGVLTLTTGSFPASYASPGTVINIAPATPPTSTATTSGLGGDVSAAGGPGQPNSATGLGNGTGGAGGSFASAGGVGGAVTVSGNTRLAGAGGAWSGRGGTGGAAQTSAGTLNTGGAGGMASVVGGDGGAATTGASGTRNGGAGGNAIVGSGAGGAGSTANGVHGSILLQVGGATAAQISPVPTVGSGFGTSPSVTGNGTAAFTVNVGTGGTASSGVLTMPAAATGWICSINNITSSAANRADQRTVQTGSSTTSVTIQHQTISTGAALAWTASDVVQALCFGY